MSDSMSYNPDNNEALRELHAFVSEWRNNHDLNGIEECHYLSLYLAGRIDVLVSLENIKKWDDKYDERRES